MVWIEDWKGMCRKLEDGMGMERKRIRTDIREGRDIAMERKGSRDVKYKEGD